MESITSEDKCKCIYELLYQYGVAGTKAQINKALGKNPTDSNISFRLKNAYFHADSDKKSSSAQIDKMFTALWINLNFSDEKELVDFWKDVCFSYEKALTDINDGTRKEIANENISNYLYRKDLQSDWNYRRVILYGIFYTKYCTRRTELSTEKIEQIFKLICPNLIDQPYFCDGDLNTASKNISKTLYKSFMDSTGSKDDQQTITILDVTRFLEDAFVKQLDSSDKVFYKQYEHKFHKFSFWFNESEEEILILKALPTGYGGMLLGTLFSKDRQDTKDILIASRRIVLCECYGTDESLDGQSLMNITPQYDKSFDKITIARENTKTTYHQIDVQEFVPLTTAEKMLQEAYQLYGQYEMTRLNTKIEPIIEYKPIFGADTCIHWTSQREITRKEYIIRVDLEHSLQLLENYETGPYIQQEVVKIHSFSRIKKKAYNESRYHQYALINDFWLIPLELFVKITNNYTYL